MHVTTENKTFVASANANGPYKYPAAELSSEQEEGDTKMFLCSQYALQLGFDRVSTVTIGTDVAIVAMYFQSVTQGEIYLETLRPPLFALVRFW